MDIPQSTPTVPVSTEEISDETTTIRHHHLNKVIGIPVKDLWLWKKDAYKKIIYMNDTGLGLNK